MSRTSQSESHEEHDVGKKRKAADAEIEIDLNADEPFSKKALRKSKKSKPSPKVGLATGQDDFRDDSTKPTTTALHNGGRSGLGIWIGNLPFEIRKTDLESFLTEDAEHTIKASSISRINLPGGAPRYGKPQNKGFAYIDFSDAESLQNALQLSEKLLLGRRVLIKDARSFEGRPQKTENQTKSVTHSVPSSRIFVGNLGFDVTADDLKSHFEAAGPVANVHMATFEDTGKCKGFGWVQFDHLTSAEAAMRGWIEIAASTASMMDVKGAKRRVWLNRIEGRKLRMEYAEDQATRYTKRFGKSTPNKEEATVVSRGVCLASQGDESVSTADPSQSANSLPSRARARTFPRTDRLAQDTQQGTKQGYSRNTVSRLRGVIVPGQGQKLKFE